MYHPAVFIHSETTCSSTSDSTLESKERPGLYSISQETRPAQRERKGGALRLDCCPRKATSELTSSASATMPRVVSAVAVACLFSTLRTPPLLFHPASEPLCRQQSQQHHLQQLRRPHLLLCLRYLKTFSGGALRISKTATGECSFTCQDGLIVGLWEKIFLLRL